jgi:hypothetical protein
MIKGFYKGWFIQIKGDCMFAFNPATQEGMVGDKMVVAFEVYLKCLGYSTSTLTVVAFVPESKRLVV